MLEISRDHWLGDQTALEAPLRFSGEGQAAERMPAGYSFAPAPNETVLKANRWQHIVCGVMDPRFHKVPSVPAVRLPGSARTQLRNHTSTEAAIDLEVTVAS